MCDTEFKGLFAQQGWQCPICKKVYSPLTPMCLYCGNDTSEPIPIRYKTVPPLTENPARDSFAKVEQLLPYQTF